MYFILFYSLVPLSIVSYYYLFWDKIPFWLIAIISPILGALTIAILLCLTIIINIPLMRILPYNSKFKKWFIVQALTFGSNVIGLDYQIIGKENIPSHTKYVVYGNHKSYTDVMLAYSIFPHPMTFVGKQEAWKAPIVRSYLIALGAVPIDRKNDRTTAISMVKAINHVKSGLSMGIFPEGGIKDRSNPKMVGIKAGAYKLAQKAEAAILPFSIRGSINVKKNAPWRRTKMEFIIHKPIPYEDYKDLNTIEIGEKVFEIINGVL